MLTQSHLARALVVLAVVFSIAFQGVAQPASFETDPAQVFQHPPEAAKPGALWMWMGSNLSAVGMTRDLEALHQAGFNRITMFSLAGVTTPWAGEIGRSPTPDIVAWQSESWWKLLRHAAQESQRLHMAFGAYNGAGYEASGGTWITPALSRTEAQEVDMGND